MKKKIPAIEVEPGSKTVIRNMQEVEIIALPGSTSFAGEKKKWLGTEGQLAYLYDLLRASGFYSLADNMHQIASSDFEKPDGKPFTNLKQAKTNYQNTSTEKPERADVLENIVAKVKAKKD